MARAQRGARIKSRRSTTKWCGEKILVRAENAVSRCKNKNAKSKHKNTNGHQRLVGTGSDHDTPPQEMSSMALPALNYTHSYNIKAHTHIIAYIQPYARTHLIHTLRITTNTVANSYHSHEHRSRPVNQDYSVILSHVLSHGRSGHYYTCQEISP